MSKESKMEAMAVHAKEKQAKGHPMKHEKSVESELPEGMKKPKAPGDSNKMMAGRGGMEGSMGKAVSHLERETERGKHAPKVGGHDMGSHSGEY